MQAQVKEWGNNQETRLSKDIRKSAGIELNENLDVSVANGVITLMKPFHHKDCFLYGQALMKGKRERYIRCETLSMLDLLILEYKRKRKNIHV